MSIEKKVVRLTLNRTEFVALVAAANLGVFAAKGDLDEAPGRLLFESTRTALNRLGPDGWNTLLDQVAKLGDAAFPELSTFDGSFQSRGRKR